MRSKEKHMTTLSAEKHARNRVLMQRMRKGTHSCSECRRRKVKCIYIAGQDRCKECRFRGSNCVEQYPNNESTSSKKTKSMRERISELEALVQTLLSGQVIDSAGQSRVYIDDVEYSTPMSTANSPEVNLPPLMRLFDNQVITPADYQATVDRDSQSSEPSTPYSLAESTRDAECDDYTPRKADEQSSTKQRASKDEYTRKRLLECINFGEGLDDAFQENKQRWITWRSRILGNPPNESFADWGKSVIRNGSPSDLGALVLLLAIGSDQMSSKNLIPLVKTLITSDDDYNTTLSGIECSLLLSDYHCSIGQPRRAWLAIQRGLASSQLIGLQHHCSSPMASGMVLLLHYENQFLSLMLGIPRGIDFHCNIDYANDDIRFFKSALCTICNKYLIETQHRKEPSLSLVLELDQQLQALILAVPTEWKEFQPEILEPVETTRAGIDQDKTLIQMRIQQLRTYLYLPLMLSSDTVQIISNPMYEMSRITCLQASRDLLMLYKSLSHYTRHENALLDFTGFSAAILIILNLLGYPRFQMDSKDIRQASDRDEQDWKTVETTISILADRAKSHDSKVIRQSLEVLRTLSGIREPDCIIYPGCKYRFIVPFFGEITAQPGAKFGFINTSNDTTTSSEATAMQSTNPFGGIEPERTLRSTSDVSHIVHARSPITISAFSGWHAANNMLEQSEHAMNQFPQGLGNGRSIATSNEILNHDLGLGMQSMQYNQHWQYLLDMDLNQDWLFLAEPSSGDAYMDAN